LRFPPYPHLKAPTVGSRECFFSVLGPCYGVAGVFFSTLSTQHCSVERYFRNSPANRNLLKGTGTLIKSLPRPTVSAKPLLPLRSHFSTESVVTVSVLWSPPTY